MNPGDLKYRITIEKQDGTTRDTVGGVILNWVNVCTVWASVEPLTGREFFASQQVNSETTHRIRIRYRAGIKSSMRVLFGTRIFEIVSPPINPKEQNQELQLMCKEVV